MSLGPFGHSMAMAHRGALLSVEAAKGPGTDQFPPILEAPLHRPANDSILDHPEAGRQFRIPLPGGYAGRGNLCPQNSQQ